MGCGVPGTAATFSSTCGSLPNRATEEIFIFHTRKCVVGRDFILTPPLPPGKKEVGGEVRKPGEGPASPHHTGATVNFPKGQGLGPLPGTPPLPRMVCNNLEECWLIFLSTLCLH